MDKATTLPEHNNNVIGIAEILDQQNVTNDTPSAIVSSGIDGFSDSNDNPSEIPAETNGTMVDARTTSKLAHILRRLAGAAEKRQISKAHSEALAIDRKRDQDQAYDSYVENIDATSHEDSMWAEATTMNKLFNKGAHKEKRQEGGRRIGCAILGLADLAIGGFVCAKDRVYHMAEQSADSLTSLVQRGVDTADSLQQNHNKRHDSKKALRRSNEEAKLNNHSTARADYIVKRRADTAKQAETKTERRERINSIRNKVMRSLGRVAATYRAGNEAARNAWKDS